MIPRFAALAAILGFACFHASADTGTQALHTRSSQHGHVTTTSYEGAASSTAAKMVEYEMQVRRTKAGKSEILRQFHFTGLVGNVVPMSALSTSTYIAKAEVAANGMIEYTPGNVVTGFFASIVPLDIDKQSGAVKTAVTVHNSILNSMDEVTAGELSVQKPDVSILLDSSTTLALKPGDKPLLVAAGNDGLEILMSVSH